MDNIFLLNILYRMEHLHKYLDLLLKLYLFSIFNILSNITRITMLYKYKANKLIFTYDFND